MMAALPPPTEILSNAGAKESTQRADEASIEVIHNNDFPALDFRPLPLEEGSSSSAPGADINSSEWDPHRVYFNEFLGDPKADPSNAATRAAGGDSNLQFSPFGVAGLDDEEFDSTRASVEAKPSGVWATPQWTLFRRNEDEAAPKTEGEDWVDETLDPLGWPRQPSLLLVEAKRDGEEGMDVADEGLDSGDGDDEDLLGPGLRAGRSDGDAPGVSDTAALAHHHEIEDKVHRLEQYAEVEPDEASVANSSHSSEPNQSDDDEEDEQVEVEYETQEDDSDDASNQEDLRDEFQDLVLHMAQQEKSDDIIDHGTEAAQIEFAALDPESESALATPPAFEVTWEGAAPAEFRVDEMGTTGAPHAAEGPSGTDVGVQGSGRKPAPLLKPPPEEKVRKWLAAKDTS